METHGGQHSKSGTGPAGGAHQICRPQEQGEGELPWKNKDPVPSPYPSVNKIYLFLILTRTLGVR